MEALPWAARSVQRRERPLFDGPMAGGPRVACCWVGRSSFDRPRLRLWRLRANGAGIRLRCAREGSHRCPIRRAGGTLLIDESSGFRTWAGGRRCNSAGAASAWRGTPECRAGAAGSVATGGRARAADDDRDRGSRRAARVLAGLLLAARGAARGWGNPTRRRLRDLLERGVAGN